MRLVKCSAWANDSLKSFSSQFLLSEVAEGPCWWELFVLAGNTLCGALIRFWGVGSWGLEGDEKTMALPTMHIVQFGTPLMPSGMFYGRAIGQLYLMAGSVRAFGQSEWSMRLPSLLCGIALIPISYVFGRRFLSPKWNTAFVATIAFFPMFIADSQEARMYIFLVTCLAAYGALIFRWERTGLIRDLLAALIMLIIGIQFHALAIFGATLFLYPGLVRAQPARLCQGIIAAAIAGLSYLLISHWINGLYPQAATIPGVATSKPDHLLGIHQGLRAMPLLYICLFAASLILAIGIGRAIPRTKVKWWIPSLILCGLVCQLVFFYHVGVLLMMVGLIAARREDMAWGRVAAVLVLAVVLAVAQFHFLTVIAPESTRRTIGAMVGYPSIWPMLRFLDYSIANVGIIVVGLLWALRRVAEKQVIPDYWLFFVITVWLPLFTMGLFAWDVELRYTEVALQPSLLCTLAICQTGMGPSGLSSLLPRQAAQWMAVMVAATLIINPIQVAKTVNAGYSIHPDHKGAAEYVQSMHPQPRDVIVAEDSLEQTYYLGHIDYWLTGKDAVEKFVQNVNGELRDIYTGAPLIGSAEELTELIDRPNRGAIYIIGSGELQQDGRRHFRGLGIFELLQNPMFRPVYRGRDGLTEVWRVDAPSDASPSAVSSERSQ